MMHKVWQNLGSKAVAVVAACCVAISGLGPLAAQDEDPKELFKEGVGHFRDENYRAAIEAFRQVFASDPNPFVLFNIGRCYEQLGDLEEAAKFYDWALDLGGLPDGARVEAVKRLQALNSRLGERAKWRETRIRAMDRVADVMVASARAATTAPAPVAVTEAPEPVVERVPVPVPVPVAIESGPGPIFWVGVTTGGVGLIAVAVGASFAVAARDDLATQQDLIAQYESVGTRALVSRDQAAANRALALGAEVNKLADDISDEQRWAAVLLTTGASLMTVGGVLVAYDLLFVEAPCPSCVETISLGPTPNGVALSGRW
jgi:tetratricopeptide (TPR) repeat protein